MQLHVQTRGVELYLDTAMETEIPVHSNLLSGAWIQNVSIKNTQVFRVARPKE